MDGGGSVLVVGGGSECSASFLWETSFSFDAFVGFEVAFVVPTPVGWVIAEASAVDWAMVEASVVGWIVVGALGVDWVVVRALGAVVAWEVGGATIYSAGG